MWTRAAVFAIVFALVASATALANTGILMLAHNGSPEWNAQISELKAKVDSRNPAEVAFGMPARPTIAAAVDRLAKRGVTEVIAVPFFLSAPISSEALTGHAVPVRPASRGGLDAVVAEIVLIRAEETSRQAGGEVLLFVGYGADDNGTKWSTDIAPAAQRLNLTRRFGSLLPIRRFDALSSTARQTMRGALERSVSPGRPILVVYLLPPTKVDPALEQMVEGLSSYAVAKQGVLGDERLVSWLAEQGAI